MKSDVYFAKVESGDIKARAAALKKLLAKMSPFTEYKKDEIIPVKLTIGDSTCVHHVNPALVKEVVSEIKGKGAKPFLFDTSVIYTGQRQNAVDHITLAEKKGFGHKETGAPFIVADGLLGQDGREYIVDSNDIHKIKVPSFVGMLDSLVVITHVTGHIVARYAGAIKNVAMGMSCRPTKQVQHSLLKPSVIMNKCTGCGLCIAICPVKAITSKDRKSSIDKNICIGCGECLCACKFDAILVNWQEDPQVFSRRMADVASLTLSHFKNKVFLNFALDITHECDCISTKDDEMISENIGILASRDALSVDKASLDLTLKKRSRYFSEKCDVYQALFDEAAKRGIGNMEYNLIEI